MALRVCFVVQRYGENIAGGAESHCKQIAEKLAKNWQVDIATTCAIDYQSWSNKLAQGRQLLNNVNIYRFPVDYERVGHVFDHCYEFLVSYYYWLKNDKKKISTYPSGTDLTLNIYTMNNQPYLKIFSSYFLKIFRWFLETFWMKQQGPYSKSLLNFLSKNRNHYDAFIFFSYTYATTFYGLPLVKKKSILVPTAHNDPCLSFKIFDRLFSSCRYLIYQTKEEQALIESRFIQTRKTPHSLTAIGIEVPKQINISLLNSLNLANEVYALYLGRIEPSKGCQELLQYFTAYKKLTSSPLKLVLAGQQLMNVPEHSAIRYLGFVTEEEKWALLKQCQVFIMPSKFESLSIACLEAWSVSVPVLANGNCAVLQGQIQRSQAGLIYTNQDEFISQLIHLTSHSEEHMKFGELGKKYVQENYNWHQVIKAYEQIIEGLAHSR